ncbi:MAG: pyruvate carboxylase subunit B, partial [Candidatus Omnitrophica bacterium]|nr:pyruvate carboxylase subunit B [Candidatus Omnitrophota bacterium]
MNIKEIKEMLNLMNENGLVELEIEKDGTRIKLKRGASGNESFSGPIIMERHAQSTETDVRKVAEPVNERVSTKTVEIRAPMVGTFYRAPAPEAPPYAEVGQTIEPGQVICIIEAM